MRLLTVLVCAGGLALAGCGDDEPEPAARPAPLPPVVDTSIGDTVPVDTPAPGPQGDSLAGARQGSPGQGENGREASAGGGAGARPAAGAAGGAPASGARTRLYTVQVAAFVEPGTARSWEGRLSRQGLPAWVSMAELRGRTFYRLRVGVTQSFSDALRLGRVVTDRYEWPVWVAPLSAADALPEGILESTRRLLDAD